MTMLAALFFISFFSCITSQLRCVDRIGSLVVDAADNTHPLFRHFGAFNGLLPIEKGIGCCFPDEALCLLYDACLTTRHNITHFMQKAFLTGAQVDPSTIIPYNSIGHYVNDADFEIIFNTSSDVTLLQVYKFGPNDNRTDIANAQLLISSLYTTSSSFSCSYYDRLSASDKFNFLVSLVVSLGIAFLLFIGFYFLEDYTIMTDNDLKNLSHTEQAT